MIIKCDRFLHVDWYESFIALIFVMVFFSPILIDISYSAIGHILSLCGRHDTNDSTFPPKE